MLKPLTLATVHLVDEGVLQALFDKSIQSALRDCEDRPADETAREVTLTFCIAPISADGRTCDKVALDAKVKVKIPEYRTPSAEVRIRKTKDGFQGLFNDASLSDVDQKTLDEIDRQG